MIVFTLTNTQSGQVYVGTTQDCPQQRWAQLCAAAHEGLDADLYSDIRHCGVDSFELQEWAVADSMAELRLLAEEAMAENGALSLQGIRTRPERKPATTAPRPPRSAATSGGRMSPRPAASVSSSTPAPAAASNRNKLPNGRMSNSEKERKLREALEQQRVQRLAEEKARQQAQADEMAAIMARIDSRGGNRRR